MVYVYLLGLDLAAFDKTKQINKQNRNKQNNNNSKIVALNKIEIYFTKK